MCLCRRFGTRQATAECDSRYDSDNKGQGKCRKIF